MIVAMYFSIIMRYSAYFNNIEVFAAFAVFAPIRFQNI